MYQESFDPLFHVSYLHPIDLCQIVISFFFGVEKSTFKTFLPSVRRAYQWNSDLQDEGEKDWCCVKLQNLSLRKTWSKGCRTEAHGRGNSISTYVFAEVRDCDAKEFVVGMTMYDCHICIPIFKHSQSSNTRISRNIYDLWPTAQAVVSPFVSATMAETGGIQGVQRARGNWRDAFLHRRWGKNQWQFRQRSCCRFGQIWLVHASCDFIILL